MDVSMTATQKHLHYQLFLVVLFISTMILLLISDRATSLQAMCRFRSLVKPAGSRIFLFTFSDRSTFSKPIISPCISPYGIPDVHFQPKCEFTDTWLPRR